MKLKDLGDRPLSLADHLERLGTLLQRGALSYDWSAQSQCNCGLLARQITGFVDDELEALKDRLDIDMIDWTALATQYCSTTGRPVERIFAELYDAGMQTEDFNHLEYLRQPDILAKAGIKSVRLKHKGALWWKKTVEVKIADYYAYQGNAAKYMLAWAEIIREYRVAHDVKIVVNSADQVTPAELAQADQVLAKVK